MKQFASSLTILLLTILFLGSCTKDSAKAVDHSGKIKTVSLHNYSAGSTDIQELFYNDDGTIAKYTYTSPGFPILSTTSFQYLPGKIRINTVDSLSALMNWEEDFLNSDGSIDSMIQGGTGPATGALKVIYDQQGKAIEMRNYSFVNPTPSPFFIQYNTFSNGNLIRTSFTDQQTVLTAEYSTHIDNIAGSAGTSKLIRNNNLVTAWYDIPVPGATPQLHSTLDYTFDSEGRVLTETSRFYHSDGSPNGQVVSRSFTYY